MRILYVSHHFPPNHTAGTETYAYNLARRLKEKHEIRVFYTEKRLARRPYELLKEETDGIETWVLINNLCFEHFGETFLNPHAEEAFRKVLDEFKPQVVHIHHLMFTSLSLPLIAKECGIPVVMTLHDFFLICSRGGRLMLPEGEICPGPVQGRCQECLSTFKYRQDPWERRMISMIRGLRSCFKRDFSPLAYWVRDRLLKKDTGEGNVGPGRRNSNEAFGDYLSQRVDLVQKLFSTVDFFMTPSLTVAEAIKSHGLPEHKISLWKYGIDLEPFSEKRSETHPVPVFGYFGTLMPHKGVHVVVEAAASLPQGLIKTLIRGSEAENPGYADTLKKTDHPDILFKPNYTRAEVRDAFSEIDVLVLPSLWLENSPIVIQEAFASGCPVITSDSGGMRELVKDGVNGRLFPPGDTKALGAIMEEVGKNPKLLSQWRRGIERPRSIENDVEALESLYTSMRK